MLLKHKSCQQILTFFKLLSWVNLSIQYGKFRKGTKLQIRDYLVHLCSIVFCFLLYFIYKWNYGTNLTHSILNP